MAVSVCRILALLITFCVVLQEGYGLPLSDVQATAPQKHHIRAKRCSCNSWLDKECIYFCHLDIIWVNTPSKILPYGIGSPLSRRRRSAGRCECANQADQNCYNFCHNSSENPSVVVAGDLTGTDLPSDTNSSKLLAYLRSVIRSNLASVKQVASPRKKVSRASRLKIR